jgi:AraC-like DNA-binding protein
MISVIVLSCILGQILIGFYLFNVLKTKDDFERKLNTFFLILIFHLGTKLFILVVLRNSFLYHNNATGFGLSYGPLLFLIGRSYVKLPMPRRSAIVHLLPFILFTLAYFVDGVGYVFKLIPAGFFVWYAPVYQWLAVASLLVYPVLVSRLLNKIPIEEKNADVYKGNLLRSISYIMLTGVVIGLIIACIHFIKTGRTDFDLRLVPYLFLAVIPILIMRYKIKTMGITLVITRTEIASSVKQSEKQYRKSALDTQMIDQYETTLIAFMQKTKIYLDTEISLEVLASKVKIPKHHLTQLLNERFKKNFYAFINEYRITEAIKRLKDANSDENILSLAFDCGFNSKSSFNNYFKKLTGLTPSLYRKIHVEKLSEAS